MGLSFRDSLLTHGKNKLSHITDVTDVSDWFPYTIQKKKKAVEPSQKPPQEDVQATGALSQEEVDHADAGTSGQVAQTAGSEILERV